MVNWIMPGRRFSGRLSESAGWRRNPDLLLARDVPRPISCYAIITPGGLWHQCFEAEERDLVPATHPEDGEVAFQDAMTKVQVAWRHELDHLLNRYEDYWALGCTASLAIGRRPRDCDHKRTDKKRARKERLEG